MSAAAVSLGGRRRVWQVWHGSVPISGCRTLAEADRMIAVDPVVRRAVDTRRAPPGVPPLARDVLGRSPVWLRRFGDRYR